MGTIDLDRVEVFVAVVETGSFSAAAARLRRPKSSVSRAVAALEAELGVRLLHRTTRHVSVSTAGAALHERVAPRLAAVHAALGALPELEEAPSGRLRVTAAVDLGVAVLADVVRRFVARHPAVEVELSLSSAFVDVVAEGFDVALRISRRPLRDSTLAARPLGGVLMRLYAAPSYLGLRGAPRTPAELRRHDWVVFESAAPVSFEAGGRRARVEPRGRVRCDELSFAREAVRAGLGLGLLPTFLAESDVTSGALVPVLPRWSAPAGRLWWVTPSARHVPRKVTAFREVLLETLAQRAVLATR